MKVKSEDILKPGAVLKVEKIDFSDPEVIAIIREHNKEMLKLKWIRKHTFRFPRF